ncbi:LytR/AlgR family response regulator transcription factor [Anaerotruncus colihominis]|uniref:Stage 0 sporulation protein A homolog n=1 Tax=Anaerotruncus colihominis TaxID=169435 RepID=A0A845SNA5_9FIRM|nr:LytTR family DNA-binding domain-containing protein [Anaerotruncus colihominis]MCR2025980.1 LytTR family DNA-binding domain-containing protein [Anaerotruncus colihominis]NDO38469.1 response regulator transcription factor [Anaerotruncus colihominis]
MIKFAICDDEPIMVQEISNQLSQYMDGRKITSYSVTNFSNGYALLESNCNFDIVFLDIQMDNLDGIETAKILRQQRNHSLLIFVTVLKEYVFNAFEVEAYDYLLKPLDSNQFERTMDRAVSTLAQRADKSIVIQRGSSCDVVPLAQIVYCEVQGRKIYVHQSDGKIIDYYDNLENFERQMDRRFFRCHRSYLVNLDYIRGCDTGLVTLSLGAQIPVSRLRERDLTQALLRYMKERNS